MGGVADSSLPPGFRFHPTDEELIICYLIKKVEHNNFTVRAIGDVDLNKSEPWELPDKAKMGEKEWYFFTLRDRKYPTGMRTNRATEAGYWKATGKDRDITRSGTNQLVGAKKTLVFYRGRAPKGVKTNWIMHEYRLEGEAALLHQNSSSSSRIGMASKESEWVVCRIFQKSHGGGKKVLYTKDSCSKPSASNANSTSFGIACDDFSDTHSSLPPLLESPPPAGTTGDDYYQPPSLRAHHHHSWSTPTSTTTTATTLDHHHHHVHHHGPDPGPGCFRFPSLPPAYEMPTYDMSKLKQEFNEVLARPCKLEPLASSATSFNWESLVDSISQQQQQPHQQLQQQQQQHQEQQQHLQQQQNNGDTTGLTDILNASNNSSLYRTSTAELESLWTY